MDAALEMQERKNPGKEAVPAGIFYYNIKDPVVDKDGAVSYTHLTLPTIA